MNSFAKGNWGLKLLAVLMAVVMWVYVSNDQSTIKEQEFKAVPVEIRGLAANLVGSEVPGHVSVRVQADQNVIAELTSRSVEAFVDLSSAKTGKAVVPVQVKVPTGVKVVDLRPQEVNVTLEPVMEKQVPVKIKASSMPANGYKVMGMQAKPEEVILRGPRSVLNRIDQVSIDVNLKDRNQSFGESLPIRVVDNAGKLLDEGLVRRNPDVADLFVAIAPDLPSKTVRVIPNITGEPAKGYVVTMTSIDPAELVITGEAGVLNGITVLNTKAVNITGAGKDQLVDVEPVLPAGVNANRQTVRILVKIGQE